jgi:hypothetical protein
VLVEQIEYDIFNFVEAIVPLSALRINCAMVSIIPSWRESAKYRNVQSQPSKTLSREVNLVKLAMIKFQRLMTYPLRGLISLRPDLPMDALAKGIEAWLYSSSLAKLRNCP